MTGGHGDPTAIVGDALFMLRTEAMLELAGWMREFDRSRPDHDKVRFLGADVLELRPIQFSVVSRDDAVQHAHALLGFYLLPDSG